MGPPRRRRGLPVGVHGDLDRAVPHVIAHVIGRRSGLDEEAATGMSQVRRNCSSPPESPHPHLSLLYDRGAGGEVIRRVTVVESVPPIHEQRS